MSDTIATRLQSDSERFSDAVTRQYRGEVGSISMTAYEEALMQHIFIRCSAMFVETNAKLGPNRPPISWRNVNMGKLATDATNRIKLGLDALIPGHLYPIAYFNGATKVYDIDLRIGYKGELFYIRRASIRPILDIRVELVYETDKLTVYKKDRSNRVEGYDFEVTSPFARGELVGGFGYIEYEDEQANTLITLSKADFDKARGKAKSSDFWGAYYDEMCYKTIVHRLAKAITLDPEKINVVAMYEADAEDGRKTIDVTPQGNGEEIRLDVNTVRDALAAAPEPPEAHMVSEPDEGYPFQAEEAEPASQTDRSAQKRVPGF